MATKSSQVWLDASMARREWMGRMSAGLLGVTVIPGFAESLLAANQSKAAGKAKHIIFLTMQGAMSHLDTFDPKPGREVQGNTKAIATKTPGVQFGESLAQLADLSEDLAVIRSVNTETGAHEQGMYLMRTSYKEINSIRHPALGAWALHAMGKISKDLPGNVLIGNANDHPGNGFLDPSVTPVPIADPAKGLENIKSPSYLSEANFKRRLILAGRIDDDFRSKFAGTEVDTYTQMYREAVRLMGSKELKAFNIAEEPEKVREAYGTTRFGQACLLARRLVEGGVRFVEVELGGWDMHQQIFNDLPNKAKELDKGLSNLLKDLKASGLLQSTMVVLATEFGRTPTINENAGRDHHPAVFSCVLAGAGIRGGQVYGASDQDARTVASDGVSIADFNTTIAQAAGIPTDREFHAPNGRPFKIGGGGEAIKKLLA